MAKVNINDVLQGLIQPIGSLKGGSTYPVTAADQIWVYTDHDTHRPLDEYLGAMKTEAAETTQTFVSNATALTAGKIAKTSIVGGHAAKCKVGDIVMVADGNIYKISAIDETNITLALPALASYATAAAGSANIISDDMIHYTAEEGKVYDKLVFPNGDKYAQYFPLEGDVGTSYYYRAKRIDFSENEDEPDKISLTYIKFLLDGGRIKSSSVNADLPKYEAFEDVQTKANNSLQKPEITPTKTKLVGVGTNGQENIEIGDNLTLANGKLSATGGGGSGGESFDILTTTDGATYTGTISGTKPVLLSMGFISYVTNSYSSGEAVFSTLGIGDNYVTAIQFSATDGKLQINQFDIQRELHSHFITMTDSDNNVAIYLTIQNTIEDTFTADTLASYLEGKKVLANGNLHGVVPTYIAGEGGVIKIYYRTPGDSNINPTPDEYQDLSSFTISDLVTPVE